jgi:hypothetical protein
MAELSKTQRAVLASAISREDLCIYPLPGNLKGGAIAMVARSLLARGLVQEVPAGSNFVWRQGEDGEALTLRATKRAIAALDGPTGEPSMGHSGAPERPLRQQNGSANRRS